MEKNIQKNIQKKIQKKSKKNLDFFRIFLDGRNYCLFVSIESLAKVDLNETKTTCRCEDWAKCDWSNRLVNQLASLNNNHPFYKSSVTFFKKQICNRQKQQNWCCRGGDYAKESELQILKPAIEQAPEQVVSIFILKFLANPLMFF